MGSGSEAIEKTEEIAVDLSEVTSTNQVAERMLEETERIHRKHDVPMPISPDRLKMDLQLLTLARQTEYHVLFTDDRRRVRYQLRFRLSYKDGMQPRWQDGQ